MDLMRKNITKNSCEAKIFASVSIIFVLSNILFDRHR